MRHCVPFSKVAWADLDVSCALNTSAVASWLEVFPDLAQFDNWVLTGRKYFLSVSLGGHYFFFNFISVR